MIKAEIALHEKKTKMIAKSAWQYRKGIAVRFLLLDLVFKLFDENGNLCDKTFPCYAIKFDDA